MHLIYNKQINSDKLDTELKNNIPFYDYLTTEQDQIIIWFAADLSPEAIIEVDNLVAAHTPSPSLTDIIKASINNAMVFGQSILLDFSTENVLMGITQEGKTGEVLSKLSLVLPAIQSGSLYEAISRIKSIPSSDYDSKYITEARLLIFVNRIEAYLGLPLSTEL